MSSSSLRAILFSLAALASTSSAVSLGNFKPFLDNLSPSCTTVYNNQIAGCTADDFSAGMTCSSACMAGLAQTQTAVTKNCAKDNVSETSIIGVFQANLGIQALCPKNTASTTTSTTAKATSSINSRAASATASSTASLSQSASATSDKASSMPSGGLILDPTAFSAFSTSIVDEPTATTVQPSASSSSKKAKATDHGQLSNQSSGGGSPFDVQSTNFSSQLRVTNTNVAILLATMSLLVACS